MKKFFWAGLICFLFSFPLFAQERESKSIPINSKKKAGQAAPVAPAAPVPNFFAEQFYLHPQERLQYKTFEVEGLVFLADPAKPSDYSVVTDFAPGAIKSQAVPEVHSFQEAQAWVQKNVQVADFQGVELKKISIPLSGKRSKTLVFVGHKAFDNEEEAKSQIALAQAVIESQHQDFKTMVDQAQKAMSIPEQPEAVEIKTPAQFKREEQIALKFLDQLDIGNELFGPFQGEPSGEKIVWQSFGETTWRNTNLESSHFNSQVGFWTNRIIFRGFRAPLNTVDPYIEASPAVESNGVDFKNNMVLSAGLEWRPLARNPWLSNFSPWSLHLLEWVKSYRLYIQYSERVNLNNEIRGSANYDTIGGISIFYEWGIDLPSVAELEPSGIPDQLRKWFWGEYFGNYFITRTGFTAEDDFNALILNSSVILGVKLPGIPLPSNPFMDSLEFMPYMRLEHVNNLEYAFPYQNRYGVIAGVRWMPFRNYRWKENEWLYKTKIFAEFVGVGGVYNGRGNDDVLDVDRDFRVGINFSSRRF